MAMVTSLAIRTFHNHRKAIFDIFEVDIVCDTKGGYKYYIDTPRSWRMTICAFG